MPDVKPRRGRPKGTGIDDSDRIARLAELIKVRPELKPTTAIRAMGITDPSVIRRLRDKFSAYQHASEAQTTAPAIRPAPAPLVRAASQGDTVPATVRH